MSEDEEIEEACNKLFKATKLFKETRHRTQLLAEIKWQAAQKDTEELEALAHKIRTSNSSFYELKPVEKEGDK